MVLLMAAKVVRQRIDSLGQESHLNGGGTGVPLARPVLRDNGVLVKAHQTCILQQDAGFQYINP